MPLLNVPQSARQAPSIFEQARKKQQEQQLAQLKMRLLQAQVGQVGVEKPASVGQLLAKQMQILEPGSPGWLKLAKIQGGGVNVTTNIPGAQKTTKGVMEKAILDAQKSTLGLDIMEKTFKDEYTEYPFQAKAYLSRKTEKWGAPLPGEESFWRLTEKQLGDFAAWEGQAEKAFLTFRKWATGVAGGEKEMAAIRKAFATKDKSATEFKSMIRQAKAFETAYIKELTQLLIAGSVINKATQAKAATAGIAAAGIADDKTVRMVDPNGQTYDVPASEVNEAEQHKWRVVQ